MIVKLVIPPSQKEEKRHLESGAFPNPSRRNSLGVVCFSHPLSPCNVLGLSFPLLSARAPTREGMFVKENVTREKAAFCAHQAVFMFPLGAPRLVQEEERVLGESSS